MATSTLVILHGRAVPGREWAALQLFKQLSDSFAEWKKKGLVESMEAVQFEPRGDSLDGFVLLRGDREKLNSVRYSEEFLHSSNQARLVITDYSVVAGFIGEELQDYYADYGKKAAVLADSTA